MKRRRLSFSATEEIAILAATHVCCAQNASFRLTGIEKSPVTEIGGLRSYGTDGDVLQLFRTVDVFCYRDRKAFIQVSLIGNKWEGRPSCTYWHVAKITSRPTAHAFEYCYRQPDVDNPYWSGFPSFHDLQKVMGDGRRVLVAA